MAINRRNFVKVSSAAAVAAPMISTSLQAATLLKKEPDENLVVQNIAPEYHILNKIAYGPKEEDVALLKKKGLEKYLKEQLNPKEEEENPIIAKKLSEYTYEEKFKAEDGGKEEKVTTKIQYLDKTASELWEKKQSLKGKNFNLITNASREVALATFLKAAYSKWQLREVMVEFWHNHFNIDAFSDRRIPVFFVQFDRDVIRKHCFGNFRELLEATAKSPAMLYYLNNNASKASPANENYARELFELHTLGEDNYFNELYDKWKEVPGAAQGKAIGYIDEDVYETARAFTGWTVGDNSNTGRKNERVPSSGEFYFQDSWHDHYQKRVLGVEIPSNQGPMEDAKKVLDILAYHKGTATFLCTKICTRLVSDTPPKSLISKAVATWMKHHHSKDQIAQVLKTIVLSDEFQKAKGAKVKRPFELILSFIRASDMDFNPNQKLYSLLNEMGYQLFQWPAPTGHPDEPSYWTGAGMMLKRWKAVDLITNKYYPKATTFDTLDKSIEQYGSTATSFVSYWYKKLIGAQPSEKIKNDLVAVLGKEGKESEAITIKEKERARKTVASIAMLAEFQVR